MDLFRFTAPGVLDVKGNPAQYSLDGNNLQQPFNDPSGQSGDQGDWNLGGDCYGNFASGVRGVFTPTDYVALRGIGYTGVAAPAPIFNI